MLGDKIVLDIIFSFNWSAPNELIHSIRDLLGSCSLEFIEQCVIDFSDVWPWLSKFMQGHYLEASPSRAYLDNLINELDYSEFLIHAELVDNGVDDYLVEKDNFLYSLGDRIYSGVDPLDILKIYKSLESNILDTNFVYKLVHHLELLNEINDSIYSSISRNMANTSCLCLSEDRFLKENEITTHKHISRYINPDICFFWGNQATEVKLDDFNKLQEGSLSSEGFSIEGPLVDLCIRKKYVDNVIIMLGDSLNESLSNFPHIVENLNQVISRYKSTVNADVKVLLWNCASEEIDVINKGDFLHINGYSHGLLKMVCSGYF